MPTTAVPVSGPVNLSAIQSAFPGKGNSLGNYLGAHSALPASGTISFSSFKGLTAASPAHALGSASGSNVSVDSTGAFTGTVGTSQVAAMSYSLSNYVLLSAYQNGAVTYAVTSGTLPTGVTLSPSGTLTINSMTATSGTVSVGITATNPWGNTAVVPVTFNFAAATAAVSAPTGWSARFIAGVGQAYSSGTSVSSWTPSGTSSGVFSQGTVASQPTYVATGGGINANLPYVYFNGSNYLQNSSGTFNLPILTGGGFTFVAHVLFLNATDNYPRIFTGNGTGSYMEIIRNGTGVTFTLGQAGINIVGSSFAPANVWFLLGIRYTSATKLLELFKDTRATTVSGTFNSATTDLSYGNTAYIGKSLNSDPLMNMYMNFMIMYSRPLSNADMDTLMSSASKASGLANS